MLKIFDKKERKLNKYRKVVEEINEIYKDLHELTNEELKDKTDKFKEELKNGKSLNDILPEAFAVVKEASKRVLGKEHYDVQLIGGMALHEGYIAEMMTGEGKTLTETLPAYLNALNGKVHIVTVNDYLAKRDSDEMGKVFEFLGVSSGCIHSEMDTSFKKIVYKNDIIYGTSKEFGFDYLRDNMAADPESQVITGLDYVIVDEIDSVLIDESMTPLIITRATEDVYDTYLYTDIFVKSLERGDDIEDHETYFDKMSEDIEYMHSEERGDFRVNLKSKIAQLTSNGIRKAEEFFKIDDLSKDENLLLSHMINQSLKANYVMKDNVDYLVDGQEVLIIDSSTGRAMPGRRFSDGLHQAIEAKEGVKVNQESVELASITLQNFYSLYNKLSGMTGTAITEEKEFKETYGLEVITIPTNKPIQRVDHKDLLYISEKDKYAAILEMVKESNGAPILIGTPSIEKSEELSLLFRENKIKHRVLNAKNHKMEANLIAQAGRLNAVTIATNMAGRGTDIMLGGNPEMLAINEMKSMGFKEDLIDYVNSSVEIPDVSNKEELEKARKTLNTLIDIYKEETDKEREEILKLGGLLVIGTEKNPSRRIDNQLRGRAGRQGDPGQSVFMISLEDEILQAFGSKSLREEIIAMAEKDDDFLGSSGIKNDKIIESIVLSSQKANEEFNFGSRKDLKEYDDVIHHHRNSMYNFRNSIVNETDSKRLDLIFRNMLNRAPEKLFDYYLKILNKEETIEVINETMTMYLGEDFEAFDLKEKRKNVEKRLTEMFNDRYDEIKDANLQTKKALLVSILDQFWIFYLSDIKNLKDSVKTEASQNQQPITLFKERSANVFKTYIDSVILESFNLIYNIEKNKPSKEKVAVL